MQGRSSDLFCCFGLPIPDDRGSGMNLKQFFIEPTATGIVTDLDRDSLLIHLSLKHET
jgi:hypothetical protein